MSKSDVIRNCHHEQLLHFKILFLKLTNGKAGQVSTCTSAIYCPNLSTVSDGAKAKVLRILKGCFRKELFSVFIFNRVRASKNLEAHMGIV